MRFSILFVERKRLQGCFFRCRVSFEWFYVNVGQKIPNLRDPSPGTRKCWIVLDRALKETERSPQILFAALVREKEALQIKIVCFHVALFVTGKRNSELDLVRVNNCARDFILQRKHPLQFAFVGFGPNPKTVACINQLCGYSNAVTLASQTSFKHILDV